MQRLPPRSTLFPYTTLFRSGLGMIPVKYGSGYNFVQIEQAAAIISINQGDGSVLVHQGGVEMGQGLTTQIVQIASYVLNVPMEDRKSTRLNSSHANISYAVF